MLERIVFADVERSLVDHLTVELAAASDPAKVVTQVPDPAPPRMVRVVRDDRERRQDKEDRFGRRGTRLILDRPRVRFECSDAAGTAAELLAVVRSILTTAAPGYIGPVWCDHIDDAGVENESDPATAAPRYVLLADLYVRGTVLA